MLRISLIFISCLAVFLMAGCNFPARQVDGMVDEPVLVVTLAPTETSPFEPMLTPTPTLAPVKTEEPPVTPTPGLQPGLQYFPPAEGEEVTITGFDMIDLQNGWGEWTAGELNASGSLLRSEDGGQTWQVVTPPPGYPSGSRFFALDGQRAWAVPGSFLPGQSVQAGYVWRTRDGGATWLASLPIEPQFQEESLLESFFPQALYFLDEQHGWLVVSAGHYMNQDVLAIFATSDGGLTWLQVTDKFSMGQWGEGDNSAAMPCRVSGIAFIDDQTGYMSGDCLAVGLHEGFSVLVTQDGGRTWQEQVLPTPASLPGAMQTAIAGQMAICADTALESTPAGILVQHTCQLMEGSGRLKNDYFLSLLPVEGEAWINWAGEAASFANAIDGYSLGQLEQNGTRSISKTSDGGKTWQQVDTVSWPEARLDFPAVGKGFALAWRWDEEQQAFDYALVRTDDFNRGWALVEGAIK
jgi:photosystem II stability/assembly factor-like uncharacterized protein